MKEVGDKDSEDAEESQRRLKKYRFSYSRVSLSLLLTRTE